jgi:hypothetical protein
MDGGERAKPVGDALGGWQIHRVASVSKVIASFKLE